MCEGNLLVLCSSAPLRIACQIVATPAGLASEIKSMANCKFVLGETLILSKLENVGQYAFDNSVWSLQGDVIEGDRQADVRQ